MGGERWCVLCLEVSEEPTVTEEPNLSRRSPNFYIVRWGYGTWAGMASGGYDLGSSFIKHHCPLRLASISRTKF
ncbi:hypothetical protein Scep_010302 [Stephania cephalantha]|uniref:Uncharacterized protein n=1 Tax=Stephania cephalantha TaxID=152367 RepID=A0AAP0PH37_9MAGN